MKSRVQRKPRARGFALIVTLSLMILLTVIAVGLLTLSSITLRSAGQGNAMAAARANARMALMLAIGDLQKNAGPDQRVTARADVINENIANPRLTGVWDSWEIKPTAQPADFDKPARDAKFRGWLASGDPIESRKIGFAGVAPLAVTGAAPKSAPAVTLWGKGTLGTPPAPKSEVTVNKIPLASPPGAMAWAVMDEGIKARINTRYADDIAGVTTKEGAKSARLGAGERPGVEFMAGLKGLERKFFETGAAESAKLQNGITRLNFSLAGEQLAGNTIPPALKSLSHDVTTVSAGLFTDTARGGLKQDFQLLTNASTVPAEYKMGVYASRLGMPSASSPSDPRWESLQQFATIYKDTLNLTKLGAAPLLKTKTPNGWNASTLSGSPPTTLVNRTPPAGVVLTPTVARVQMLFSLIGRDIYPNLPAGIQRVLTTAEKSQNMHGPQDEFFRATNYNYDLHLLYTPVVTLHNPYNVALEFNTLRLEFIGVPFAMQVFRNDLALSKGLVPFESMTDDNQNSQQSKIFGMELYGKVVNGQPVDRLFRMLPGEVITFSPYIDPARTYAQDLKDRKFWDIELKTGITKDIKAVPGWRGFGIGYDCDWLAGNQPIVGNASQPAVDANKQPPYGIWRGCYGLAWNDRIHVEFAPLSIPVNNNKFVIQMTATVGGLARKVGAVEMDYKTLTGLQELLSPTGGKTTLRYPKEDATEKYILGHQLRDTSNTPIGSIANAKPFALLTAQAKNTSGGRDLTNKDGRYSGKPWAFANGSVGSSSLNLVTEHSANGSHEIDLRLLDGSEILEFPSVEKTTNRASFITGNTNYNGTKFGSLYDVPLAPVQTLAGLNGANPGGSSGYLPRFAQPIGNSWAHPLISPDKLMENGPNYNYLDHSFLLNLALYDGFYFSGLADQTGNFGSGKNAKALAESFAAGTPLDDPRMTLLPPDGKNASDLAAVLTQTAIPPYKSIAAWQTLDGPFNINSTSVPAWKAMLASIHDSQALVNQRATPAATATSFSPLKPTATDKARISRMRLPASSSAADGGVLADAYWLGPREYSDAELQTLADNIVKQVRLRGPFLSLAEFVNRRLGTDEMAQRGALQQAIDDSDLNQSLAEAANAGYEIPAGSTGKYKHKNPKAGEGASYQGAPGYLTQADILNVLGNAATARSDTFTIRGYGESRDPGGKLVASATCEAVVQRVPDWVDSTDPVETPVASLASSANKTFGRRFLVTSFRWLNAGEI